MLRLQTKSESRATAIGAGSQAQELHLRTPLSLQKQPTRPTICCARAAAPPPLLPHPLRKTRAAIHNRANSPSTLLPLPGAAPRTHSKRRSRRPSETTASECRVNSARSAALQLSLHPASPREAGFFAQDVSNARLRQSRPGKKARSAETPCLRRLLR